MVRQRDSGREQPIRGSIRSLCLATLVVITCTAYDLEALDKVTLEVGQISSPSVQATGANVTFDMTPASGPTLDVRLDQLRPAAAALIYSEVAIGCSQLIMNPPLYG